MTFASLSVRPLFLSLVERHLTKVHPSMLRPALKAVILALLPGLEDETSEDFERVLNILDQFKKVAGSEQDQQEATESRSQGEYFWQCFFLASIASISRRQGVLAFLVRRLPRLGDVKKPSNSSSPEDSDNSSPSDSSLPPSTEAVLYPEPGLLVRCFVTGLTDDQMLVQRGFLDLLVTCLPMHSHVFRSRISYADQRRLISAAIEVVVRRDMSLNRRLWVWILGPEDGNQEKEDVPNSPTGTEQHTPTRGSSQKSTPTQYFIKYGFRLFVSSLREMLSRRYQLPADRARPFRICLSLMDRWEFGVLILPEIFMSAVDNLRQYEKQCTSSEHFTEVLRSASGFFDVVESGLICGELTNQLEGAIQVSPISIEDRAEYFAVVSFTVKHVDMREEEMLSIHLPWFILAILTLLESRLGKFAKAKQEPDGTGAFVLSSTFELLQLLISMVPARAFVGENAEDKALSQSSGGFSKPLSGSDIYRELGHFYTSGRENLDYSDPPFSTSQVGELLLLESTLLVSNYLQNSPQDGGAEASINFLVSLLSRYSLATSHAPDLFTAFYQRLESTSQPQGTLVSFSILSTLITVVVLLRKREALQLEPFFTSHQMTQLLPNLVRQLWGYLSPSNIKHHIETVHCLWQLQSAMNSTDHTIEACICALMIQSGEDGGDKTARADAARKISLLWTHSLQSHVKVAEQHREKRPSIIDGNPQSPITTARTKFKMMLARPVFLLLDALSEEGTEHFLVARNWLQSLGGIEK